MDRMPPVPENGALPANPPRVNDYDILAEAYTAENEASLINAYYARPAILALAGDVAGRRILDAGCGSGPLFAALRDRGCHRDRLRLQHRDAGAGPAAAR